jgi:hypothetical protein
MLIINIFYYIYSLARYIKNTGLIGLLILAHSFCHGRPFRLQDSLKIQTDSIHYTSAFEKKLFVSFINSGTLDHIGLLLALDPNATEYTLSSANNSINDLVNTLQKKLAGEKDLAKKLKYIFKQVHSNYFNIYDINASFDKIFTDGTYNCVTGTALFAAILDKMNINYVIKEKPHHAYLIADPGGISFPIESTDPTMKYFIPDEKFKKAYIDYLVTGKMILNSEVQSKGYELLFNKYYYSDSDIDLRQLIGLHYYNSGVGLLTSKDYLMASYQFEKGYLLYPSERLRFMLLSVLYLANSDSKFSSVKELNGLIKLYNYAETSELANEFYYSFVRITNKYLIEDDNSVLYDTLFFTAKKGLKDSELVKKISKVYFYEKARTLGLKGNYVEGLKYIGPLYSLFPQDVEINSLLSNLLISTFKGINDYSKIVKLLDSYTAQYPTLATNKFILSAYARCYLVMSIGKFNLNQRKEGLTLLKLFESIKDSNEIDIESELIGRAYGEGSASHVRSMEYKTARALLNKGLTYAPYEEELNRKLRILNDNKY